MSLSARRAWIEIRRLSARTIACAVALRKESVDRNICSQAMRVLPLVALRKESVDRNNRVSGLKRCNNVALRKESVDRNG